MYWLFSEEKKEQVRETLSALIEKILVIESKPQHYRESMFTFSGRKCYKVAEAIIESLSEQNDIVYDPFLGSGTFLIASQYSDRRIITSELDPYMHFLHNTILSEINFEELDTLFSQLSSSVEGIMNDLYSTTCICGEDNLTKSVYFDFSNQEYINPTKHERIKDGLLNLTFVSKCKNEDCNRIKKQFDEEDFIHLMSLNERYNESIVNFPNHRMILNSRINITAGRSDYYSFFFTNRQKIAISYLWNAIQKLPENNEKEFFEMTFLGILHLSKMTDYRTQSQDLYYIPDIKSKEQNIWFQFVTKYNSLKRVYIEIAHKNSSTPDRLFNRVQTLEEFLSLSEKGVFFIEDDYREIGSNLHNQVDLILTDPPYKDQVPYLERSQLYYPWLGVSLNQDILSKEIVITNAPSRKTEKNESNYWNDIDEFMKISASKLKTHKYMAFYFQPSGGAKWLSDLNKIKLLARKNGLEPLQTFDLVQKNDPSKRKIASATWSFSNELLLVFIKLDESERYWFNDNENIDKVIYKSIQEVVNIDTGTFTLQEFIQEFYRELKKIGITYNPLDETKVLIHLQRYATCRGTNCKIKDDVLPPFMELIRQVDVELRIYDYTPHVVEELLNEYPLGFTYPDFLLRLSFYLDNGEKEIIKILEDHGSDSKIKSELNSYVLEVDDKLIEKPPLTFESFALDEQRRDLNDLSGVEFEELMVEYYKRNGYTEVRMTKATDDRGVDITANYEGESHVIQCKRWGRNPVSATPIQRLDSFRRSRNIDNGSVITTSYFTPSAISEARITGITLISGSEIRMELERVFPGQFK